MIVEKRASEKADSAHTAKGLRTAASLSKSKFS